MSRRAKDAGDGKLPDGPERRPVAVWSIQKPIAPMSASILVLILLLLLLLGALPSWPYSRSWGYYPSGGFGLVLVIVLVLLLLGVV